MALAETTLSSACALNDQSIVVASATSIAAGRLILIDREVMVVAKNYSSGTTVPVLRGQAGTPQEAHVVTARVTHGDPSDFTPAAGKVGSLAVGPKVRKLVSITADNSTVTLPAPGEDLVVLLNGTSVINLTVPVPTKELDGTLLWIVANGKAAHVVTFTGGFGLAGSSYDVATFNGNAHCGVMAMASNEAWVVLSSMTGTLTNMVPAIA